MLLAGTMILGIVGLYLVSRDQPAPVPPAKASDAQIAIALMELAGKTDSPRSPRTPELVATLDDKAERAAQPLANVSPFIFKPLLLAGATPSSRPVAHPTTVPAQPDEKDVALRAVQQLRLQGIVTGPGGARAVISDRMVSVGDLVDGWTVRTVSPSAVVLAWKEQTYTLRLER